MTPLAARLSGGMDKSSLRHLPQKQNIAFSTFAILFQLAGLALTPMIWAWSGLAFFVYLLVYGYATVMSWLLIHEAIHYKLLHNRQANDWLGRVHAILFGCPFHILKVGHMTHHRYNRSELDTTELVPRDTRHFLLWWLAYYARILGGLYMSEVLAPLMFFFWKRVRRVILAFTQNRAVATILDMFTRRMVETIQFDAVLSVGFIALQCYCNWDDLTPFVLLFFSRGLIVSFYDNAYHYGTDPNDPAAANNLSVPAFVKPFILNHNMHRVHHRHPLASWASLPDLFVADADSFAGALMGTGLKQLKGPMRRPPEPFKETEIRQAAE
ncbi:fatty acid desaturase family protein [Taklimakanibacter deserti]|uniref:fatty acid desaturase family protein n=1 Tax=Taklimakanibacter deserti TaxID=2267839 RepID=UPI0013C4D422